VAVFHPVVGPAADHLPASQPTWLTRMEPAWPVCATALKPKRLTAKAKPAMKDGWFAPRSIGFSSRERLPKERIPS